MGHHSLGHVGLDSDGLQPNSKRNLMPNGATTKKISRAELVVTGAMLVITSALLVVTRS